MRRFISCSGLGGSRSWRYTIIGIHVSQRKAGVWELDLHTQSLEVSSRGNRV